MNNDSNTSQSDRTEDNSHPPRKAERKKEDSEYSPVIIKRDDQTVRHPDDILLMALEEGIEQHERSALSLILSAVAAGLILGFAAMAVAFSVQLSDYYHIEGPLRSLLMAIVYPLGFIVCIMSGTQLFTEHTATAFYPVLDKKMTIRSLIKVWTLVLIGNFAGTLVAALILSNTDEVIGNKQAYLYLFEHLTHFSSQGTIMSSILAGWLMAQGGWLIFATPPSSSQMLCIYIVTFLIGIGGLHHSIVGSAEIFCALLTNPELSWLKGAYTIMLSVIGNLIGGSIFVGTLNYAYIRKTR